MKKMLVAAVVSMTALTAQGAIETTFNRIAAGLWMEGNTYNVYSINVTTDTDWTATRLVINLSAGSFGNHSRGTNSVPTTVYVSDPYPDRVSDTYLQTPDGAPPSFAGAPAVFPDAVPNGDTQIDIGWFDIMDTGPGTHTLGQFALTPDARGTVAGRSYDLETQGVGVDIGIQDGTAGLWTIGNGAFHWVVPEPATGSLLAIGTFVLIRRRRRRNRANTRPQRRCLRLCPRL